MKNPPFNIVASITRAWFVQQRKRRLLVRVWQLDSINT
jgi:hypothetical protein